MKNKIKISVTAIILLISFILLSIIGNTSVYAIDDVFSVTNVEISEKSDTADVAKLDFDGTALDSEITFHKVDDHIKFKIEIKNTSDKDYKIKSITDNNDSEYITYDGTESVGTEVKADSTAVIYVVAKYSKAVDNIEDRSQEMSVDFEITLEDADENTKTETISINPKTGDPIAIYIVMFIVSTLVLVLSIVLGKNVKKNKKVLGLFIALVLVAPVIVNAAGNGISLNFKNKFALKDKLVITYIDTEGKEATKVVDYGESIQVLEPPTDKEGYDCDGWADEDGNKVEKFTDDVKLTPKYELIEYKITYVLDDGVADNLPEKYTIESESFTLPKPNKEGMSFIGWTGSNGETPEREVTIEQGSTGDKNYTANYIEYDGPKETQSYTPSGGYIPFGSHTGEWKSFEGAGSTTYPWPENLGIIVFENPISRARLGFSPEGYVTYGSQDYLHGNVSYDRMTMWFDNFQGYNVDGYYTVGYTENGIDHEIQFRIVSGEVFDLAVIY